MLSSISFLRISAFGFLIHKAFDTLLGGLFKLLEVYFYFGNLAICRQKQVQFVPVGFHCLFYIGLLQAVAKASSKSG